MNADKFSIGKKVAVIGAGVSGIGALRHLAQHGIDVVCFEKTRDVGGLWVYHDEPGRTTAYKSLHTKGPRESFGFPDMPMDERATLFPSWSDVTRYLNEYVDKFGLRPLIRFSSEVARVHREGDAWSVKLENGESYEFDAVVIANGHHHTPRWPDPSYPGTFNGEQIHSHDYQSNLTEVGKRTLVVGAGNSAVDIAVDAAWVTDQTFMSIRRGFHLFPQTIFGRPRMYILDLPLARLPRGARQWALERMLRVFTGSNSKYGLPEPEHRVLESRPTISDCLLERINNGFITPKPGIERFEGDSVRFVDGTAEKVDRIIWATGYVVSHPFLDEPRLKNDGAYMDLYMRVIPPGVDGLYFVGLLQPVGAMPPIASAQSELIAAHLTGTYTPPTVAEMRKQIAADQAASAKRFVRSDRHKMEVEVKEYLEAIDRELTNRSTNTERRLTLSNAISWS